MKWTSRIQDEAIVVSCLQQLRCFRFDSLLFPFVSLISRWIWLSRLLFTEVFGSLAAAMDDEDEEEDTSLPVRSILTWKASAPLQEEREHCFAQVSALAMKPRRMPC